MCYFVSACMMFLFAMRFDVNLGMRERAFTLLIHTVDLKELFLSQD